MSPRRIFLVVAFVFIAMSVSTLAAEDPAMSLARDGWLYAGGHPTTVGDKQFMVGQMYAEYMIPAKQSFIPIPIIMVHGGTMSGTNYTGTPDGREGWAQYFIRRAMPSTSWTRSARAAPYMTRKHTVRQSWPTVENAGPLHRPGEVQPLAAGPSRMMSGPAIAASMTTRACSNSLVSQIPSISRISPQQEM